MRKILYLIAVLFITGSTMSANPKGATNNDNKVIVLTKKKDDIKPIKKETDVEPGNGLTPRSVILQPVYAYLCNEVVNIDFTETFSTVSVIITNESTAKIVYSKTNDSTASIYINLNGERSGNYLIEIEADDTILEGEFSL